MDPRPVPPQEPDLVGNLHYPVHVSKSNLLEGQNVREDAALLLQC